MDIHTKYRAAAGSCLNIHKDEQMKAENWYHVAWMPIYYPDKSKLSTQGYKSKHTSLVWGSKRTALV